MKIIFIHGRSQQGKDPDKLKKDWTKALLLGFEKIGQPYTQPLNIEFPYYGNFLFEETNKAAQKNFQDLLEKGADFSSPNVQEEAFIRELVFEIAAQNGITESEINLEANGDLSEKGIQNWRAVLAALRLLNKIPNIGSAVIEQFTRDVWCYLTNKGVRMAVHDIVNEAFTDDEECIIVGHSLGSVVAYNILMNKQSRNNIKKFITLGSPLGIKAIFERLPTDNPPRKAPSGISTWFNARDKQDVVALYEIPKDKYKGSPIVDNYSGVKNTSENRHGIVEYLSDPNVATEIRKCLL